MMRIFGIELYMSARHPEPLLHCAAYKMDAGWVGVELASLRLEVSWTPGKPFKLTARDALVSLNALALAYLSHWNIL